MVIAPQTCYSWEFALALVIPVLIAPTNNRLALLSSSLKGSFKVPLGLMSLMGKGPSFMVIHFWFLVAHMEMRSKKM